MPPEAVVLQLIKIHFDNQTNSGIFVLNLRNEDITAYNSCNSILIMRQSNRTKYPYEVPSLNFIFLAERLPVICASDPEDGETQDINFPDNPAF